MHVRLLTHPFWLAAALAACAPGNASRWGVDTDPDTDTGTGVDADTDLDTDLDTDTDTDPDTDTDTEQGQGGGPGPDCHPADPIGTTGWSRTYLTTFDGRTGTEVQTPGDGSSPAPNGTEGYLLTSILTPDDGGSPITMESWNTCIGGQAVWLGDTISGEAPIIPGLPFPVQPFDTTRRPQSPEPYLPDLATLNSGGIVDYTYELMVTGSSGSDFGDLGSLFNLPNCTSPDATDEDGDGIPDPDSNCITVEGTLTAFGRENVTVGGVTWSAWKIVDEKTEKWSEIGGSFGGIPGFDLGALFPGFGGSSDKTIVRQIWYVEGIGVVKELTFDIDNTSTPLVSRELLSTTNLP